MSVHGSHEALKLNTSISYTDQGNSEAGVRSRIDSRYVASPALETTRSERQLYKLRDRVALIQFDRGYTDAQANSHTFLYPTAGNEVSIQDLQSAEETKKEATRRPGKAPQLIGNLLAM
jgi:hypothetical protein